MGRRLGEWVVRQMSHLVVRWMGRWIGGSLDGDGMYVCIYVYTYICKSVLVFPLYMHVCINIHKCMCLCLYMRIFSDQ